MSGFVVRIVNLADGEVLPEGGVVVHAEFMDSTSVRAVLLVPAVSSELEGRASFGSPEDLARALGFNLDRIEDEFVYDDDDGDVVVAPI